MDFVKYIGQNPPAIIREMVGAYQFGERLGFKRGWRRAASMFRKEQYELRLLAWAVMKEIDKAEEITVGGTVYRMVKIDPQARSKIETWLTPRQPRPKLPA